jgi:hypothetical protein
MGGGGRTGDGGRTSSIWWNNMKVVGEDVGEGVWRWIEDNTGIVRWGMDLRRNFGRMGFKGKFSRLFALAKNKLVTGGRDVCFRLG